jgi:hypothetical protein
LLLIVSINPSISVQVANADDTYERICLSQGWTPVCAEWTIFNSEGVQTNRVIGPNDLSALLAICGNTGCGLGVGGRAEKGKTYSDEPGAAAARAAATAAAEKARNDYLAGQSTSSSTSSGQSGLGGYAVIHPDGHVCGVIVATSSDPFGNGGFMPNEYMGCPVWSRIVFQTTPSDSGNVAGYSGNTVTYDANTNSFSISNNSGATPKKEEKPQVTLVIKDGVATDSTGKSFDTGTGLSASTSLSNDQYQQLVKEINRRDSAESQRQNAITQAQSLARQTPGIERCVNWSGFLENGKECAIYELNSTTDSATVSTRSVLNSLESESSTVLSSSSNKGPVTDSSTVSMETLTVVTKKSNEFLTVKVDVETLSQKGDTREMAVLASRVESNQLNAADIGKNLTKLEVLRKITASSSVKLPNSKISEEFAIALTPEICSIVGLTVTRVAKGLCTISYTLKSPTGNTYTSEKNFQFR